MSFWRSTSIRVLLIRVVLYGCSLVLAGGVWAWAVGATCGLELSPGLSWDWGPSSCSGRRPRPSPQRRETSVV